MGVCRDCDNRAVAGGYCAAHQKTNRASESRTLFDRYRSADDPIRAMYKLARWQRTRLIVFRRDPLCCECGHRASRIADHHPLEAREIVEQFGQQEFFNPDRSRGLCKLCHDIKTATTVGFARGKHA